MNVTELETKIESLIEEKVAKEVKKYLAKPKPLYGIWKDAKITDKDIEEAESWLNKGVDKLINEL